MYIQDKAPRARRASDGHQSAETRSMHAGVARLAALQNDEGLPEPNFSCTFSCSLSSNCSARQHQSVKPEQHCSAGTELATSGRLIRPRGVSMHACMHASIQLHLLPEG